MGNWTPGPWAAERTVAPEGWNIEARQGTYTVAVARDGAGLPQNEANARLIAAAPELLEALIEVRKLHQRYCDRVGASDAWATELQARVKSAIAKATGEQP